MKAMRKTTILVALMVVALGMCPAWAGGAQESATAPASGGATMKPTKFGESPILAEKVAKGTLPSVEKRLPPDPMVLDLGGGIGKYGGTLRVFAGDVSPWQDFTELGENGPSFVPYIFTSAKQASDLMSMTAVMRPGIKWSDGTPLTMDDVLFSAVDMHMIPELRTWGMSLGGTLAGATALDQWTVKFEFKAVAPTSESTFIAGASYWGLMPAHYLKKWHVKYNPDAEAVAKAEGYAKWTDAFYAHYWFNPIKDIKRPVLQPWMFTSMDSTTKAFERNPYYSVVDKAGNQLPYIDKIVSQVVDQEIYNLKIVTGESDVAFVLTSFEDISLFKQNEKSGGYTVHMYTSPQTIKAGFFPNFTSEDPIKKKLINEDSFRRALSVAINRDEINKVVYFGYATPTQATAGPAYSFNKKEWETAWAQYDPALANRMLDEIGISKRDSEGFRLGPDGKPMVFVLGYSGGGSEESGGLGKTTQLVKEYWEKVGVRVLMKPMDGAAYSQAVRSNVFDISVNEFPLSPYCTVNLYNSALWQRWLVAKEDIEAGRQKLENYEGGKLPGEEPPEWVKVWRGYTPLIRTLIPDTKEYNEACAATWQIMADKTIIIGTVGKVPMLLMAKNYIGNVPATLPNSVTAVLQISKYCQQMYINK